MDGRDNHVLASAAKSATYNMVLQLLFRILTFGLNAFTLRYVSRDLLGVVNVRLMLLYSTTAFVSREAFRRVCLSRSSNRNWTQVVNLLWCTLPIGVMVGIVLSFAWLKLLQLPDPDAVPHYAIGVYCYTLSIILEMITEPLYVIGQVLLFVKLKVISEGFAILGRCLVTVMLVMFYPQWGLLSFCTAQMTYTLIYICCYYGYFIWFAAYRVKKDDDFPLYSMRDFFPKYEKGKPFISFEYASLTWSFFKQSFLKQILTEGERYVMTVFNVLSFADQGLYDIINNLGSLAARFIFLPIEDSSYLFFSQTMERNKSLQKQKENSMKLASEVLQHLLQAVVIIGVTFLTFGYSYSYLLLDLYGGRLLSSGRGPILLRWYCVYVLVIAVNGITECFMFATMKKEQVDRYNQKMLIFSVIFLFSSWQLTLHFGSVGFIWANCLNMLARIVYSSTYINQYYKGYVNQPLTGLMLPIYLVFVYVVALVVTSYSEVLYLQSDGISAKLAHIGIGMVCLSAVLFSVFIFEKDLLIFMQRQYSYRKEKKQLT